MSRQDPINSARPQLLADYRSATDARADALDETIRTASAAAQAYATTCPGTPVQHPPTPRLTVDELRALALATAQIGQAFADADHTGSEVAHVGSAHLSEVLLRRAPGLSGTILGEPAAGAAEARRILALPDDELVEALETLDPPSDAWASGFVEELGADGLTGLVGRVSERYGDRRVHLEPADHALRQLARALVTADELDLSIIRAMGRDAEGRNALRHLAIGARDLPTSRLVALAHETLRDGTPDEDRTSIASRELLEHRMELADQGVWTATPVLVLLAENPEAARRWQAAGSRARTPLEVNLRWNDEQSSAALVALSRILLVDPVRNGEMARAELEFTGSNRTQRSEDVTRIAGAAIERFRGATDDPAAAGLMVDLRRLHPRIHDTAMVLDLLRNVPDPAALAYYRSIASDPAALRRATNDLAIRLRSAVRQGVRETSATGQDDLSANPLHIAVVAAPLIREARALQVTAYQEGWHDNGLLRFGLGVVTDATARWAGSAVGAVTPLTGQGASAAAEVVTRGVGCGVAQVDEELGHRNERADLDVARRLEPMISYAVASEIVRDPRLRRIAVNPDELAHINPLRSEEDGRRFTVWVRRQPDRVREPIEVTVRAGLPTDYLEAQGCDLPGG